MNLWALIPAPWRIWAYLGAALAVLSTLGVIAYRIDSRGYDRCEAHFKSLERAAWKEAANKIKKEKSEYEKRIQALQDAKDGDSPVGPLTTRAVDSLRK